MEVTGRRAKRIFPRIVLLSLTRSAIFLIVRGPRLAR